MTYKSKLLFAFASFLIGTSSYAELKPTWEISGATSGSFLYQSFGNNSSNQNFFIGSRASRFFLDQLAGFADVSFNSFSSNPGATNTVFSLAVGPQYNFCADIQNSFYALAGIGVQTVSSGAASATTNAFKYLFGVGKRFELLEHVVWSPEFNLSGNGSASTTDYSGNPAITQSTLNWSVRLFQFSILF